MKNTILLFILLLPMTGTSQHAPPVTANDWLKTYIQNNHRVHSNNKLSGLRTDTLFLSGTRTDTFDLANSVFNIADSAQYLYNTDSTLYAWVRLVNDPDTGWINYLADYYGYDAEK
ncbi:MAG: hypothetical protein ABIQ74_00745 [Chitinophagales bacterium]